MRKRALVPLAAIVAFPFRRNELSTLHAELAGCAEVWYCQDRAQLMRTITSAAPDLVLVAVRDRTGVPTSAVIREVRRGFPLTPVVVYCEMTYADLRATVEAGRAGAHHVIIRGHDSARATIDQILFETDHRRIANVVLDELKPLDTKALRWLVHYCLAHVREPLTVERVARARGVSPGTLNNELRRDRLATPGKIVSWCRLLAAAHGLENPGSGVHQIATELGFSSASALRMMLKRYTGLRPSDIRERGGVRFLACRFGAWLLEGQIADGRAGMRR